MAPVRLLISLDYELFFGARTGTVERSLIEPTEALAACAERAGCRLSLFVDAGYLVRARAEGARDSLVRDQHAQVARQLEDLAARGHDLQLHIHPHWQDCTAHRGEWQIDTQRYRLHDYDDTDIEAIVDTYQQELRNIKQAEVFAYRAGGWCMQPFERLAGPLRRAGIWLDSTVYRRGFSETAGREYDFRRAPTTPGHWRFDDDPLTPVADGYFLEVPISACRYGIGLFWRLAWQRLTGSDRDKSFGDGNVMPASSKYYLRRLLAPAWSPVSIDRGKAAVLPKVFADFLRSTAPGETFNVMGHPKSVTRDGVASLERFLRSAAADIEPITFAAFSDLAPRTPSTGL